MARGGVAGALLGAVVAVTGAAAVSLYVGPPPRDVPAGDELPPPAQTATPATDATVDPVPEENVAPVPEGDVASMPEGDVASMPEGDAALPPDPDGAGSASLSQAPVASQVPDEARSDDLPDTPPIRFEDSSEPPAVAGPPPAPARRPGTDTNVTLPDSVSLNTPVGPDSDSPATADTAPTGLPDATVDGTDLPAPQSVDAPGAVAVTTEAPVLPTVQGAEPAAPPPETEPSVTSEPAQPPVPQVPQEDSGLVVAGADDSGAPRLPRIEPAPQPEANADEDAQPDPQPDLSAQDTRPAIGTPAVSLIDRNAAATRLPAIGDAPAAGETGAAAQTPLQQHAVAVEVPGDLPLMSVVLLDDATGPLGPEAFDAFPFPLTFAIDPTTPDAAARMQGYRDQGFEVVVLGRVPDGAQATDIEVALAAAFDTVPQAVAVIEPPQGGLQSSRAVSDQVAQVVRDSGHGLVLMPNGLNTAQGLATREGVPAATVFRDFDGDGQDARTIRRFLDGAAFRARQNGNVIMLGRLRADTISALLLWGLQDRAAQVSLVPVSRVLTGPDDGAVTSE